MQGECERPHDKLSHHGWFAAVELRLFHSVTVSGVRFVSEYTATGATVPQFLCIMGPSQAMEICLIVRLGHCLPSMRLSGQGRFPWTVNEVDHITHMGRGNL